VRPRHTDAELLELARAGSAPAFASLLHRHREVVQRAAVRAEHPERAIEATFLTAVRVLRRDLAPASDVRGWLTGLVEQQVTQDPGRPGVERLLPTDWFDRAWVRVESRWPSGRRIPRAPRWATWSAAAVLIVVVGAGATYLVVTSESSTDVVSELVAEPLEDPSVVAVPGPLVDEAPEEVPELFGDVELGQLPTYDLTGESGRPRPAGPTVGPAAPDAGAAPDSPADDDGSDPALSED
jgi:hypothetical protein